LLHRYFVDRHGWHVQGLEAAGKAWNSSSPTVAFGWYASLKSIFEERLRRGLNVHEVAVFAATLEGLVHREMLGRLRAAYRLSNASEDGSVNESGTASILETYMLMYVLGLNHAATTPKDIFDNSQTISFTDPNFHRAVAWVHKVRGEVLASSAAPPNTFATTARVLETAADRYGVWQNQQCLQLKDSLVPLAQPGTGRVPLAAFYGSALKGNWQFSENKAYLRQMGALDETDPGRPSVMVANYVNGPSNCVAASAYYSVCCISECEAIQGHLERRLAAPDAEPNDVAQIVSTLSSSTVSTPRSLTALLERRLWGIATQHGGRVPLHSRLFGQWLHYAYPLECPFPHISGRTSPVTMERWMQQTGEEAMASDDYMRRIVAEIQNSTRVESGKHAGNGNPARLLPWLEQEELFIGQPAPPGAPIDMSLADVGYGLLVVAIVVTTSMAAMLARSVARARSALAAQPRLKLSV